ncbi:MAG: hypothetical protein P9M07_04805 [Candidatus Aceula meridiana]|nr:hypothetical protein [Candidatus Aceula meridiana]
MKKESRIIIGVLIVSGIVLMSYINKSIMQPSKDSELSAPVQMPVVVQPEKKAPKKKMTGKMTSLLHLDPNRVFYFARFFDDGEEIAQCKTTQHKVYDCTESIPDGKVEFKNETKNTHGVERYRRGKRDGMRYEYYNSGQLKYESSYLQGTLQTHKEYYSDGILRMEQDFRDAMWMTDNSEAGAGKVYYRNGALKYEWSLTNQDQGGYAKSYDNTGRLVAEKVFDKNGNIVTNESYR